MRFVTDESTHCILQCHFNLHFTGTCTVDIMLPVIGVDMGHSDTATHVMQCFQLYADYCHKRQIRGHYEV